MKYFCQVEMNYLFKFVSKLKYSWCIPGGVMSSSHLVEKKLSSFSDKQKSEASAYGLPPAFRFLFAALFNGSKFNLGPNETFQ
jgi:hypothetical protein